MQEEASPLTEPREGHTQAVMFSFDHSQLDHEKIMTKIKDYFVIFYIYV